MNLEIVTPDKKLFEGTVKSAVFNGVDGSFGVLNHHVSMILALQKGEIKLIDEADKTHQIPINSGVIEIINNTVIVLAS